MSSRLLIVPFVMFVLAGCNTTDPVTGSVDPGFGEAVKYNAAVQTIDPQPVYTAEGMQPGEHGEVGADAVKRYRSGEVKQVEREATSSGSGGAGPQ